MTDFFWTLASFVEKTNHQSPSNQSPKMTDSFQTITETAEGLFTDRGSKFFAYAFPVTDEEAIKSNLEALRKEHWKARHHCYAYRLGTDGNNFRANDDGEPSGSAGKPILGQLDSFNVTNVLIVVVRYFGGTKLGVGGLINAYRTGASEALTSATIENQIITDTFIIQYDYEITGQIMSFINQNDLKILNQTYNERASVKFEIIISKTEQILEALTEQSLNEGFADNFEVERI
jgi:uncharacterized YigZ family protein